MIEAQALTRRFGDVVAVDRLALRVPEGTILALLGPNGAGKTTTVRMLAGLLAPSAGTAVVAGCDVCADPTGVRAQVGLVTDVPGLYEQMTAPAYLDFFGWLYGIDATTRARRIDELLGAFDLTAHRRQKMAGYSRGMKQKVALARALLHEPAALFLDEPTAGLDPITARAVRELILGLKQASRSIILCTHDLDEAERLADEVAIMGHGRIIASDTPAALRAGASPDTLVRVELAAPCPPALAVLAELDGVAAPAAGQAALLLEYRTARPRAVNPQAIARLLAVGAQVVAVTCTTRTLEDVYVAAVGQAAPLAAGTAGSDDNPEGDRRVRRPASTAPTPVPDRAGCRAPAVPGTLAALLLIGRRGAGEAFRDRMTLLMSLFTAFAFPAVMVLTALRPLGVGMAGTRPEEELGLVLAAYLLMVGLLPSGSAVGIAAGQFAGEKEQGNLAPLLAAPASNVAIFGGKVLGAVLPALALSLVAEGVYLVGLVVAGGADRLRLVPPALALTLLALVPVASVFAAIVASLISSRVRTYNAAQQLAGLVLLPFWGVLFGAAFRMHEWGPWALLAAVVGLIAVDVALTLVAAATWRREEVLAHR